MAMKSVVKCATNRCRIVQLAASEQSLPHSNVETPMCLLYTRGGLVPHVTKDLLNQISDRPAFVQMPVHFLAEHKQAILKYSKGIAGFAAMTEYMTYMSVQDSAEVIPSGYNCNAGIALWNRGGKQLLNCADYMKFIDACQPTCYQALCDSDTNRKSSLKRVRKSVDRTLSYLDSCIELQRTLPRLSKTGVIGVIEGGFMVEQRKRSAVETAKRAVGGFSIEGFQSSPDDELRIADISELLSATVAELPDDKPRLLPGAWSALDVVKAVQLGIDVFDSSHPYLVTNRGSALVFRCSLSASDGDVSNNVYEICLKDDRYRDELCPLVEACTCYTCSTHSRAYIHHLLSTSELLANVLLMIHNLQHYLTFFRTLRDAVATDSLAVIERQLESCDQRCPIIDQHDKRLLSDR